MYINFSIPFTFFPNQSVLLDRMPPQIGHFISSNVYDNKLSSNPKHPILNTTLACQFIDTKGGETKDGTSFKGYTISFLALQNVL